MLKSYPVWILAAVSCWMSTACAQQNNVAKPAEHIQTRPQATQTPNNNERVDPFAKLKADGKKKAEIAEENDRRERENAKTRSQTKQQPAVTHQSPPNSKGEYPWEDRAKAEKNAAAIRQQQIEDRRQMQNIQPQREAPLSDADRAKRGVFIDPNEKGYQIRRDAADRAIRRDECFRSGGKDCNQRYQ